jgi:hypothetical protein
VKLLVVFLALAAVTTSATADPVRFDARVAGSTLELTFTNTSSSPIEVSTRIDASVANYDWLVVDLAPQAGQPKTVVARRLGFVTPRRAAALRSTKLAPSASTSELVDLAEWALRHGAPLADGSYDVTVGWDASHDGNARFKAKVTTTMTIAPPVDWPTSCATTPGSLGLLARQVTGGITVGIHNTGTTPVCIQAPAMLCMSSDAAVSLTLDGVTFGLAPRTQACDKSGHAPIVELGPGSTLWRHFELAPQSRGIHRGVLEYGAMSMSTKHVWAGLVSIPFDVVGP